MPACSLPCSSLFESFVLSSTTKTTDAILVVEPEVTEKISGTGLGLSILKAIVKKHSGRVWVQSELGSTLTLLLPRYAEEQKPGI